MRPAEEGCRFPVCSLPEWPTSIPGDKDQLLEKEWWASLSPSGGTCPCPGTGGILNLKARNLPRGGFLTRGFG